MFYYSKNQLYFCQNKQNSHDDDDDRCCRKKLEIFTQITLSLTLSNSLHPVPFYIFLSPFLYLFSLSIYLSFSIFLSLFFLSLAVFLYFQLFLSIYFFYLYLSFCISICLSVSLSVFLSFHLFLPLSLTFLFFFSPSVFLFASLTYFYLVFLPVLSFLIYAISVLLKECAVANLINILRS